MKPSYLYDWDIYAGETASSSWEILLHVAYMTIMLASFKTKLDKWKRIYIRTSDIVILGDVYMFSNRLKGY